MSTEKERQRILLVLLPYWEPQIPPMGIVSLKSFLQANGYTVKTVDANVLPVFTDLHNRYFALLEEIVPEHRQGNVANVGQDVMRSHMMAHLHYQQETDYTQLIKTLVYQTFYTDISDAQVCRLKEPVEEFYTNLSGYFLKLLKQEKPHVLGLSVYRGNLAASLFAFKVTKETHPHIKTVMGGAVFAGELAVGSQNLEYFLQRTPYIDKIIAGEGELLFLKYLQGELPETQRLSTLEHVRGETFDIHDAPMPDFSDLDLAFYPHLAAYASRSCPFQCSFCSETIYWGKYRQRSIAQVAAHMKALYERHHCQLFLMCDSLLNPIITELANALIESGVSLYWDGYLRVDAQAGSLDNTFLWRRGGFYRARLGIESGSPQVLESMGKKISVDQVRAAVSTLASAGIKTTTYWVVGHPGESEADFQHTLDLISELREYIYEAWCSPFNFYPAGQVKSAAWEKKSRLLYPPQAREMLVVQTWILDMEPSREEAYRRLNRFAAHCRELGIPNPYSLVEFYRADERWKNLHRNAVPSLLEFANNAVYIDEKEKINKAVNAQRKLKDQPTFDL